MGKLIRSMDWGETPVGPVKEWPQSLRTAISICLNATMPISILWGKELVQFYNNAYIPIATGRHPDILGGSVPQNWPDTWPGLKNYFKDVFKGFPVYVENVLLVTRRNGMDQEVYYTMSFSPIRDESGEVGGVFHAILDTTDSVIHERRLQTNRALASEIAGVRNVDELFNTAVNVLSKNLNDIPFILMYRVDEENKLRLISVSGISVGLTISKECIDLEEFTPDQEQFLRPVMQGKIHMIGDLESICNVKADPWKVNTRQAVLLPVTLPGKSHPEAIIFAGVSPLLVPDNSYINFYEQVANQLSTSLANIMAYEEERKRSAALAEIDQAKTNFFNNISHEFRTPLTLMLSPLQDILSGTTVTNQREQLQIIHRNGLRLQKLVNTLLDFSRIEAGRVQANFSATNLAVYTADLASNFRSAVEKAGIKLSVSISQLSGDVYVDRDMWEKIVLNLLSNAFKHTFEGEIEVRIEELSSDVLLTIKDTGEGIPQQDLRNIFDRFKRVEGAKARSYEGSGIGLSLVQELVKLHQGKIEVESREGVGTTFFVYIPKGKRHLNNDQIKAKRVLQPTSIGARTFVEEAEQWLPSAGEPVKPAGIELELFPEFIDKPRVILADDNADMRAYVSRLLAARFDVIAVTNGREALNEVAISTPDLLLLDVMMPVMDGFEVLKILKSNNQLARIPVIMLSARAGEEARLEGIEAGADAYLVKPFSANELITRVNALVTTNRARQELEQQKDDFIGIASHELKTPVTSLMAYTQILLEKFQDTSDEISTGMLTKMNIQLHKLAKLISDLLDVTKIEQSRLEFRKEEFEFNKLVRDVAGDLQSTTSRHKIMLNLGPDMRITADRDRTGQVVINLLTNAIKYSPNADKIIVTTEIKKDQLVFSIKDYGLGLSEEDQKKVFERFYRAGDPRHESSPGLGLGLYISAGIIQRQNGEIWVNSTKGEGSVFGFSLPIQK